MQDFASTVYLMIVFCCPKNGFPWPSWSKSLEGHLVVYATSPLEEQSTPAFLQAMESHLYEEKWVIENTYVDWICIGYMVVIW